ncbi:hypothetical protein Ddye_000127 [Dipteronia dyeriana]|uniref:Uncharacterized protein n=1 Tax=Dipteronia dyeriana TaxID=168575 RepID=A0AAD9XMC5_9ROSI|nr:hypothetical protein Ddye_000127 [Dipteronia dyeriana]
MNLFYKENKTNKEIKIYLTVNLSFLKENKTKCKTKNGSPDGDLNLKKKKQENWEKIDRDRVRKRMDGSSIQILNYGSQWGSRLWICVLPLHLHLSSKQQEHINRTRRTYKQNKSFQWQIQPNQQHKS